MATYYVDNQSAGGGNGTTKGLTGANAAFKNATEVNAHTFRAGDSILLNPSQTHRGEFIVSSSGQVNNYINYGSYTSARKATISGAEILPSTWTKVSEYNVYSIIDGLDDAFDIVGNSVVQNNTTYVYLNHKGSPKRNAGFRFVVPLLKGQIVSAKLQLHFCLSPGVGQNSPNCNIYGEAADNPLNYAKGNFLPVSRNVTTATVSWQSNNLPQGYNSVDITNIIKEIMARPGYNGVLNILTRDIDATQTAVVSSFEHVKPTAPPQLIIETNPVYRLTWNHNPIEVWENDVLLKHATSNKVAIGSWWWDSTNNWLYLLPTDGRDPNINGKTYEVVKYNKNFHDGGHDYIKVSNILAVKTAYTGTEILGGIVFTGSHNIAKNCISHDHKGHSLNASGNSPTDVANDITFDNCEAYCTFGGSYVTNIFQASNVTVKNCNVHNEDQTGGCFVIHDNYGDITIQDTTMSYPGNQGLEFIKTYCDTPSQPSFTLTIRNITHTGGNKLLDVRHKGKLLNYS